MLAGLASGALASAIANPTDLIKVRMQGSAKHPGGKDKTPTYHYKSFWNALSVIVGTEGFWALYTG